VRHAVHEVHHRPTVLLHQVVKSGVVTGFNPEHYIGISLAFAEQTGIGL